MLIELTLGVSCCMSISIVYMLTSLKYGNMVRFGARLLKRDHDSENGLFESNKHRMHVNSLRCQRPFVDGVFSIMLKSPQPVV